ncbi:unnamed protein product [Brassica rapa subsp. narinosa]
MYWNPYGGVMDEIPAAATAIKSLLNSIFHIMLISNLYANIK